jgi:hypothetical protein
MPTQRAAVVQVRRVIAGSAKYRLLADRLAGPYADVRVAQMLGRLPVCAGVAGGGPAWRRPVHMQGSACRHRGTPHGAQCYSQRCAFRVRSLYGRFCSVHWARCPARRGDLCRGVESCRDVQLASQLLSFPARDCRSMTCFTHLKCSATLRRGYVHDRSVSSSPVDI